MNCKYFTFILFIVFNLLFPDAYAALENTAILNKTADEGQTFNISDTSSIPVKICTDTIFAVEKQNEYVPKWYDMFKNLPGNWKRYYDETFTKDMIAPMVGMTVLTGALIVTDEDSWHTCRKWYERSSFVHKASDMFVYMGDGQFQFGLSAAFAAYGFAFNDYKALRTASQITEVILSAGAVVQVLKHLTGRESPIVKTETRGRWDFFPNQIEYHKHVPHFDAFPSGHICTATSTLVVIMENYPDAYWLKPFGYTVLGCIATGLVTTSIHWWSDIPLGVAIGYAFGKIVASPVDIPVNRDDDGKTKTSMNLLPTYSERNGFGLNMNVAF